MNAKAELIAALAALPKGLSIIAAVVERDPYVGGSVNKFTLPKGYTVAQLESFIEALNFEYDNGYGTQELYGTVWLSDGSWLTRHEHDGAEWWEHRFAPPIPPELAGEGPQ